MRPPDWSLVFASLIRPRSHISALSPTQTVRLRLTMNTSARRIGPLLSLLLALAILVPAATQPAAAAPPNKLGIRPVWGACGAFSEETKLVFDYGFLKLRCGSVKTRADGYNHIKANHKTQFTTLAAPAGRTWEDLVHFALAWNQYDPDEFRVNKEKNKACRSRVLRLVNQHGKVVSEKVYKVIYVYTTGKVITIFPSSDQCTNANVGLTGPQPLSHPLENS